MTELSEINRRILRATKEILADQAAGVGLDQATSVASRVGGDEKPGTMQVIFQQLGREGYLEVEPLGSRACPVRVVGLTPKGERVIATESSP